MKKTTAHHFNLFRETVEKYVKEFGILDWDISFLHCNLDGSMARVLQTSLRRTCVVMLTTDWNDSVVKLSNQEIIDTAKHEVVHIILGNLRCVANARFVTEDEMELAEESLVVYLMNFLFKEEE